MYVAFTFNIGPFNIWASSFNPLDKEEEMSTAVLDSSSTRTHHYTITTLVSNTAGETSDHTTGASNNEVSTNEEIGGVTTGPRSQVPTGMTTAITSSPVSPHSSVDAEQHSTEKTNPAMDTTSSVEESEGVDTEQTTVDHTTAMGQEDVTTTSTSQSTSVETVKAVSIGQIHQQTTIISNEEITTSMHQVYRVKSSDALTSRSTYGATSGETTRIHSTTGFSPNESEITGTRMPDEVSPETGAKTTPIPELNLTEPSTITTAVTYNESAANITRDHTLLPDNADNHSFVSGITTSDLQSEVNVATSSPWDGLLSTSESYGTGTPVYRLEWDSWLPWSGCSLTCGGGTRYRFKICKPAPDNMTSYNVTSECSQELGHGFCEFTIHFLLFLSMLRI